MKNTLQTLLCQFLGLFMIAASAHAEEILIGQVAPLSGVLAETGKDMVLGGQIYFDHINQQGGVRGKKSVTSLSMMLMMLKKLSRQPDN